MNTAHWTVPERHFSCFNNSIFHAVENQSNSFSLRQCALIDIVKSKNHKMKFVLIEEYLASSWSGVLPALFVVAIEMFATGCLRNSSNIARFPLPIVLKLNLWVQTHFSHQKFYNDNLLPSVAAIWSGVWPSLSLTLISMSERASRMRTMFSSPFFIAKISILVQYGPQDCSCWRPPTPSELVRHSLFLHCRLYKHPERSHQQSYVPFSSSSAWSGQSGWCEVY